MPSIDSRSPSPSTCRPQRPCTESNVSRCAAVAGAAGDLVDVDELQIRPSPAGAQREPAHAAEAVDADSDGMSLIGYSGLRMTVALDGHAEVNSTDVWTDAGTSARAIRSKPNFGKYRSAVVVSR